MKIVHTSDWHLGQIFYNRSRLGEQKRFINWLQILLLSLKIDVIIVAGDVFDTSKASYEAQKILADFLAFCIDNNIHAIITTGNHDSPDCLNINKKLANTSNLVHIITFDDEIINLGDVIIAAAPFLIPKKIADLNNIEQYTCEHFSKLANQARAESPEAFLIGVGHLATSNLAQESENPIYIGKQAAVNPKKLNMFDYFALGHIHKASGLSVRYSGSIMPMGFDETDYEKSLSIICVDEQIELSQARQIHPRAKLYTVKIPTFMKMINAQISQILQFDESLENAYINVEIDDLNELEISQIQQKAKELDLNLSKITRKNSKDLSAQKDLSLEQLSPQRLVEEILKEHNEPFSAEIQNHLHELVIQAKQILSEKEVDSKDLE